MTDTTGKTFELTDPSSGREVVAKAGRFGPYVTELLPEAELAKTGPAAAKPRTASLLKSMALDTVTLEDALRLLTLPRTLGDLDGEPVTVQNGRYGPYVKKGTDSRSLDGEEQLFTLSLAEAKELFDQPKARGRMQRASREPLKTFDASPVTTQPVKLLAGRYGPYVTDGETNASLPQGMPPEELTFEQALELLADRRSRGPAKKRAVRKKRAAAPAAARKKAPKVVEAKATVRKSAKKKSPRKKKACVLGFL